MPILPAYCYDTSYKLQLLIVKSDDPYVLLHYALTRHIGTHKRFSLRQARFGEVSRHIILLSINLDVLSYEIKDHVDWKLEGYWCQIGANNIQKACCNLSLKVAINALETDHNCLYGLLPVPWRLCVKGIDQMTSPPCYELFVVCQINFMHA